MNRPNRAHALKCQRCRDDKQVCLPRERAWQERKCDRCIRYHYNCGPNLGPPRQLTSNAVEVEEYRKSMDLVYCPAFSLGEPNTIYACMSSLRTIVWDSTGLWDSADSEGDGATGFLNLVFGIIKGEMYMPNSVASQLWERANYIGAYDEFDETYAAYLANNNASEAKRLATEAYVEEVCRSQIRRDSEITSREDIGVAVRHILLRGERWRSIANAIGSAEILLMDDTCHVGVPRSIADIIQEGTSQDFDTFKNNLLLPEGRLQDLCMALTGVGDNISQLSMSHCPRGSEIRQHLISSITGRFESVFGPLGPDVPMDPHEKVTIPLTYLSRSIRDIFGISWRFPLAKGTLTEADKTNLSAEE